MSIRIDGTNTTANPGITGADTDTGLQIGTNELKLVTGGTARATVDDSGRLMIGTTTEGEHTADDLTVATSGDTGISIRSGTSSSGKLFFSDGTSSADEYRGFVEYDHSDNDMLFGTDSTERVRIDSSGRVGIGETSMDGLLVIKGDSDDASTPSIRLKDGTDTREAWISNAAGDLVLVNGGDDNTPHCKITMFDGNIMTFATANTERMRIQSGGGLSFNGDTSTDNALDDYEEGTWTPSIGGTATYDIQWGYYVKVGAMVHCWGGLRPSSVGTGDKRQIQGLPFTALNSPSSTRTGGGAIVWYDNAPSNLAHIPALAINPNTTIANINTRGSASSLLQDTTDFWQNNNRGNFFLTYRVTL